VPVGLKPLLDTFADTREALHRVAEEFVAPARKPHNEIALRQTPGGFGTPEFEFEGRRMQVRVEGDELVLAGDGSERRTRLASIADGGALLGSGLLPDGVPADRRPLGIDPESARAAGRLLRVRRRALGALSLGAATGRGALVDQPLVRALRHRHRGGLRGGRTARELRRLSRR
jgi:hypothetical protein